AARGPGTPVVAPEPGKPPPQLADHSRVKGLEASFVTPAPAPPEVIELKNPKRPVAPILEPPSLPKPPPGLARKRRISTDLPEIPIIVDDETTAPVVIKDLTSPPPIGIERETS